MNYYKAQEQDTPPFLTFYQVATSFEQTKVAGEKIRYRTFTFEGNNFPLNSSSITVYQAIIKQGSDNQVMSLTGPVLLTSDKFSAFEQEMNDTIIEVYNEGFGM